MFNRAISDRFLNRLAASPRGCAFVLTFLVGAEEGDETGVFDHLLDRVDDPKLQHMVRRHRDDETEHAQALRACLERYRGVSVPEPLKVIPFYERELDGVAASFVAGRVGVMEAYLTLQVIEERGVLQYPLTAAAIAPYDPESAKVINRIVRDEIRHVRYAKAISERYAPDPRTLAATLSRYRKAEARAFTKHGSAILAQAVDADLLAVGSLERLAWRAVAWGSRGASREVALQAPGRESHSGAGP